MKWILYDTTNFEGGGVFGGGVVGGEERVGRWRECGYLQLLNVTEMVQDTPLGSHCHLGHSLNHHLKHYCDRHLHHIVGVLGHLGQEEEEGKCVEE